LPDEDNAALKLLTDPPSKRYLLASIDQLAISADAKALLYDLAAITIEVAGKLVAAGRKILAFIFDLMKRFPNTAFGLIVALAISTLVASIPLLGLVLGPLLAPIFLAFGIGAGALADLHGPEIRARVGQLETHFSELTGQR